MNQYQQQQQPPYWGNNYGGGNFMNANNKPKVPAMTTGLTPEQMEKLSKRKGASFSFAITEAEQYRNLCCHRSSSDFKARETNGSTGEHVCEICGTTWNMKDFTKDEIETTCEQMVNILETCKYLNVDLPPNVVQEIMPVIGLIKKIPAFYELSVGIFDSYFGHEHQVYNNPGNNAVNMINGIMSGAYNNNMQPSGFMGGQGGHGHGGNPFGGYGGAPQGGYGGAPQGGYGGAPQGGHGGYFTGQPDHMNMNPNAQNPQGNGYGNPNQNQNSNNNGNNGNAQETKDPTAPDVNTNAFSN